LPHHLQSEAADPCRLAAGCTIVNHRQRQQLRDDAFFNLLARNGQAGNDGTGDIAQTIARMSALVRRRH
jgi:hypothetical protein